MNISAHNFTVGEYLRCFIPTRQRLVPCRVEEIQPGGLLLVRPLTKRQRHHLWQISSLQAISTINPKEIQP